MKISESWRRRFCPACEFRARCEAEKPLIDMSRFKRAFFALFQYQEQHKHYSHAENGVGEVFIRSFIVAMFWVLIHIAICKESMQLTLLSM